MFTSLFNDSFILNTTIFNSLIAFVISHTFILLIQNSIILLFYRVNFNNQIASSIAGSLITFSIACAICRLLPFHSFYSQLINGKFLSKYLVIHVFLIIMLELGLRKYSTFNTIIYPPHLIFHRDSPHHRHSNPQPATDHQQAAARSGKLQRLSAYDG